MRKAALLLLILALLAAAAFAPTADAPVLRAGVFIGRRLAADVMGLFRRG